MYIMVTERCNMTCAHCCMSATSEGADMPLEVFLKACEVSQEYDSGITIGGGEPTLHKDILSMVGIAIMHSDYVFMITNGSMKKLTLKFLQAAEQLDSFECHVSRDQFHDLTMISGDVWDFCEKNKKWWPGNKPYSHERDFVYGEGRAKLLEYEIEVKDGCPCEGPMIRPNGDLYDCGCSYGRFMGNIMGEFEWPTNDVCPREFVDEEEENEIQAE